MSTPETALAQRPPDSAGKLRLSTGGVMTSAEDMAKAIKALGDKHNLIVPGGAIGADMPMLHAAGISFVFIDPANETYKIPGSDKRGIGKNALDRIAAAAGVRWIPSYCGRVDDGSDMNFVEYQVSGVVQQLDGTERTISAVKRIDLRASHNYAGKVPTESETSDWGADAREIARQASSKTDRDGNPDPRDPWPQILAARQHILSLAESKAKNRAIRSLGVRTAYTVDDIKKGFAVARLQFTGRSDNPETQHEIEIMMAQRALTSSTMLYGGHGPAPARLAQPQRTVQRIVTTPEADADDDVIDTTAAPSPARPQPDPAPQSQAVAKSDPPSSSSAPRAEAPVPQPAAVNGPRRPEHDPEMAVGKKDEVTGKYPKKRASEMSVDHLTSLIDYHESKKPTWSERWAAKNQLDLDALYEWRAFKSFDPNQGVLPAADEFADEQGPGDDEVPF